MSGRTDPPDWLDELYQQDTDEMPPAALDEQIRSAARRPLTPWYRQPARLATAATLLLAAGMTTLWLSNPQLQQTSAPQVTVISNPVTVVDEITVNTRQQAAAPAPATSSDDAGAAESAAPLQSTSAAENTGLSPRQAESENAALTDRPTVLEFAAEPADADLATPDSAGLDFQAAGSTARRASLAAKTETADESEVHLSCRQLPETSADAVAPYQLCDRDGELFVRHADCEKDYPLTRGSSTNVAAADTLRLTTDQGAALLRCSQGQWQLTDVSPPPQ